MLLIEGTEQTASLSYLLGAFGPSFLALLFNLGTKTIKEPIVNGHVISTNKALMNTNITYSTTYL